MSKFIIPRLLACALAALSLAAHAEIMDDIELRREGGNAVVQIRLTSPITFKRSTASRTSDLTQAYYQVRRVESPPAYVAGERRVLDVEGLPTITIADEPVRPDLLTDPNRRLVISLSKSTRFKVRVGKGDRTIELVLEGVGTNLKGSAGVVKAAPSVQPYVVVLARSEDPQITLNQPLPAALKGRPVVVSRRVVDGKQVFELHLGYFASLQEAEQAARSLSNFPLAQVVKLVPQESAPNAQDPLKPAQGADAEASAKEWLLRGRQAYEEQRLEDAAQALVQLLNLPTTTASQEGQELLGMVRMAQGNALAARAEFEAYLKQYPSGDASERVKGLLDVVVANQASAVDVNSVPKPPDGKPTITGSVAQYFYGGKSTVETQAVRDTQDTLLSPDQIDKVRSAPISTVDQKLLSTSMDATWRSRDTERDMRMVVRDQFDYNMLDEKRLRGKSRVRNRLSAAYLDYQSLTNGVRGRMGRQSASWGGEGRFDGGLLSYSFKPKWKTSVVAGVPTDPVADAKRAFVGVSLDADALTPNIGASVFALQRVIDGEVDRRSMGIDLRYFTQKSSAMLSTDYDILFRKLNVASLQAMYLGDGNTTTNVVIEHRSLTPASLTQTLFFQFSELQLAGFIPRTINDLKRTGYAVAQLRELVRSNTSYSTHAMASVTTPVTTQWQAGVDVHLNKIGKIAPNEVLPNGQPDSGIMRTLGLQAIGTNLYSESDTNVIAASLTTSKLGYVRMVNINNMTALGDSWQVEPSVRWLRSVSKDVTTNTDTKSSAWGPGFKATYKPRPSIALESNLNVDQTRTQGFSSNDRSTRFTYFLGYRYTH